MDGAPEPGRLPFGRTVGVKLVGSVRAKSPTQPSGPSVATPQDGWHNQKHHTDQTFQNMYDEHKSAPLAIRCVMESPSRPAIFTKISICGKRVLRERYEGIVWEISQRSFWCLHSTWSCFSGNSLNHTDYHIYHLI